MVLTSPNGFSAREARHHAGEFSYAGDEHVFIAVDTTVGVQLTQGIGESLTTRFTSPAAIHFIPPDLPSSWRHDRSIQHIQIRIGRSRWERATGTDPARLPHLAFHVDSSSSTLVRLLLGAVREPDVGSGRYVSSLVDTVALSVEASSRLSVRSDPPRHALVAVLRHIDDHLDEPLHVADLATVAGVPRRRFEREFVGDTGLSPYRYVVEARLDRAGQLLEQTAASISEVARQSGFFDQAHLTRTMRRHRGVTPAAYRRSPADAFVQGG